MGDEQEPLLGAVRRGGDPGGEGGLLEDLLAGSNFKELVEQAPEEVVQLLAQHGIKKVLEFTVENDRVPDIVMEGGIITMGADTMNPSDIKSRWLAKLKDPDPKRDEIKVGWKSNVRLEAHVVQVRNAADPEEIGLLQPLLLRFRGNLAPIEVFGLPVVKTVIAFKWETFAKKWLYIELIFFMTWLSAFTGFVLMMQDEDVEASFDELFKGTHGIIKFILDLLMLFGMLPFLFAEIITVSTYGFQRWMSIYNIVDIASYGLQISISVIHLTRFWVSSHAMTVVVALQCIVLWTKFTYFIRAFNFNTAIDTLIFVVKECSQLLFGIVIAIYSFATAFYVLYRQDYIESDDGETRQVSEFDTIGHSLATMFDFLMGGFDFDVFWDSTLPSVKFSFFLVYEFAMAIIFLNIIIASMEAAWDKFSEHEAERFQLVRADIIDELETFLPSFLVKMKSSTRFPEYIHVLKLAEKHDELEGAAAWNEANRTITKLGNDMKGKLSKVEERLAARVQALEKQIDMLVKTIEAKE